MTPNRVWIGIFVVWLGLLSGIFHSVLGSPGILQAVQLQQVLDSRQKAIDRSENQLIALQEEASRLEKSKFAQQREIRKVLGYAASNELIFDFSGAQGSL